MFLRNFLLALGAIACLAGVVLVVTWFYRATPDSGSATVAVTTNEILVAARPLATGSLLRGEDLDWKSVSTAAVPPDSYARGQITVPELVGAVVRRDFGVGDALTAGAVVKPDDRGFLGAVLLPGTRAVSIAVDAPESGSGLLMPGDQVDIILTQSFGDGGGDSGHRSVGETVLRDIRVIAVDQSFGPAAKPASTGLQVGVAADARIPKTVTLAVNGRDAEKLMVAVQLGKIELAIRGADAAPPLDPTIVATWASDVSPALLSLGGRPAETVVPEIRGGGSPSRGGIAIMRGAKTEKQ